MLQALAMVSRAGEEGHCEAKERHIHRHRSNSFRTTIRPSTPPRSPPDLTGGQLNNCLISPPLLRSRASTVAPVPQISLPRTPPPTVKNKPPRRIRSCEAFSLRTSTSGRTSLSSYPAPGSCRGCGALRRCPFPFAAHSQHNPETGLELWHIHAGWNSVFTLRVRSRGVFGTQHSWTSNARACARPSHPQKQRTAHLNRV
eukprot:1376118-Rhodomonas_salina.1